ncbi:MAG TPA: UbiA family prenyltransferase [Hanamia sp.]|nr:UbiA family prenyltransferase [Hanamia sp.]
MEFILFTSIFVAGCAVAFCMETNILLDVPFNNFSFYAFVFGATIVQYNLHYIVKKIAVKNSERLTWSQQNKNIHLILLIAGCILILYSLFSFHLEHFFILFVLGCISFLYSFPFLPFAKKRRIKDYGFLKIITLSLLWTLVTVWFPVSGHAYDHILFVFVFAKRLVFMFILCLLFDMRDIEVDKSENIKTLGVVLGLKKSYLLSYILLVVFLLLCLWQYFYLPQMQFLLPMVISAIATFITIEITRKSNSDFVYLAGIDGMMLLQAILVYLFTLKL